MQQKVSMKLDINALIEEAYEALKTMVEEEERFGPRTDSGNLDLIGLFISTFKGVVVILNVPRLLAIFASSIISGLAPALLICRWSGRTSSSVVR